MDGLDLSTYLRFVAALLFVLGLIGLVAVLARRYGLGQNIPHLRKGPPRLKIIEILRIDARQKLLLVRRDDTEHLILLGANTDVLIERGIIPPAQPPQPPQPPQPVELP